MSRPSATLSSLVVNLHDAIGQGDTAMMRFFVTHYGNRRTLFESPNSDGFNALHHSCLMGNGDFVFDLLDLGIDLNLRQTTSGQTALHVAALHGHKSIVRTLLHANVDCTLLDYDGRTALEVNTDMTEIFEECLDAEAVNDMLKCQQSEWRLELATVDECWRLDRNDSGFAEDIPAADDHLDAAAVACRFCQEPVGFSKCVVSAL